MTPQATPLSGPETHSRKKRKLSGGVVGKTSKSVSLDQLDWREVPFPEKFDDAEGFFGLEEISDVEINKDGDAVTIMQHEAKKARKVGKSEAPNLPPTSISESGKISAPEIDDEWSGFDEEASEIDEMVNAQSSTTSKTKESSEPAEMTLTGYEALQDLVEEAGDVLQWHGLGLSGSSLSALQKLGFSVPTAIQKAAIPEILSGHDVVGKAPTGSGKTLAFGIPIIEAVIRRKSTGVGSSSIETKAASVEPTALIISPTRELAHQISKHIASLCPAEPRFSLVTLTGGLSLHKQQRLLSHADIIVATPGRLGEIISSDSTLRENLRNIQFLVLDEADRLLSQGHFTDLEEVLSAIELEEDADDSDNQSQGNREDRQTLIFSATFHRGLQQKLSSKGNRRVNDLLDKEDAMEYMLKKVKFREAKPKFIDVNPDSQMADKITERILECAALEKDLYLYALLLNMSGLRTLVFLNSISAVRRLVPFLQNLSIQAHALHSEMPQKARLRSVERFSSPTSPSSVLVATDVAARGLDIPSVQFIIHYHVPRTADMYVHRSGRTARAESSGLSVLLCSPDEVQGVRRLIAKVHASLTEADRKRHLETIELDTKVIARIKPRVNLSKKIADATSAKERHNTEDNWLRTAAEELGVDYDSEDFANAQGSQKGRGGGRKIREKEARSLTKDQLAQLRAQLKVELNTRINAGVSERYITAGGLDVDSLITGVQNGNFLGQMKIVGL